MTQTEPLREILSPVEVLEILEPVDPDNLQHTGGGIYEAKWSERAIAAIDLAMLNANARITITLAAYEPEQLPNWIAVQFSIAPLPILYVEAVQ